jgi:uridine phosphorylase
VTTHRQEGAALSYPNFPGKQRLRAFVDPEDTIDYVRAHGELDAYTTLRGILFTYQRSVLDHVYTVEGLDPATTERGFRGILTLPSTDHEIGVLGGFGFGAPVATFLLENFIALGTTRFISIGTAGGLQPGCRAGDLVLCDRAIRDEGVSHHYVPSAKFAEPSGPLTSEFAQQLADDALVFSTGCSWTIDTPYRESVDEARQYQREGVLCVEMEAAALFTVASFRSVQIASAFVVSDLLDAEEWHPQMRHDATTESLNRLYSASVSTLRSDGPR